MNLLPFIITILSVLALFSLFQMHESHIPEVPLYQAYSHAHRSLRNQSIDQDYRRYRSSSGGPPIEGKSHKMRPKKPGNKTATPSSPKPYHRPPYVSCPEGRFNLFSLLTPSSSEVQLLLTAKHFLSFFYDHLPYDYSTILDMVIQEEQRYFNAYKKIKPLEQISLPDPIKQKQLYMLLRGTHTYEINKRLGYPPLEDLITFNPEQKKPVRFQYASKQLLASIFSVQVVLSLEKEEKLIIKGKRALSNVDENILLQIINQHQIREAYEKLKWFDFSPLLPTKVITCTDPKTRLTVRAKVLCPDKSSK